MKISKQDILDAIQNSLSMREAASKLPINFKTFRSYCQQLGVYKTNPAGKGLKKPKPKTDIEQILSGLHPEYHTFRLKQRLFQEKQWKHQCSICSLSIWNSLPIPLELDHIDGNPYNHLLENLRLLCPNCHAQTPTYRSKIRKVS